MTKTSDNSWFAMEWKRIKDEFSGQMPQVLKLNPLIASGILAKNLTRNAEAPSALALSNR